MSAKYSFDVRWSAEDGAYIATCPDFPGVSATGETAEQALAAARLALAASIKSYQESGQPLPEYRTRDARNSGPRPGESHRHRKRQ